MNGCFVASWSHWRCSPGPQQPPSPRRRATSATKSPRTARYSTGTRWWATSRPSQKSSDRIRVEELGKSTEGRPFIAATIADPATLKHLDRFIAIQQKLADPRVTPQAEAEKLFLAGKAVVLVTCSIHATEIAATHTAVEFAYHLLTQDTPHNRAILKDDIVLLVPSLNPDGVDIVTRWYRKTLGTPFEGTSPPELYHHYVGHDNNRDWYIFSQVETQLTVSKLHNVWHPEIVYDVHQQGPNASRLFVPPWLDPTEPNIDPILMQEMNMYGTAIAADLTAAGKDRSRHPRDLRLLDAVAPLPGVPRRPAHPHRGGQRAHRVAPSPSHPDQIATTALGYNPRERSWNYLEPWTGGTWRLKDIIDYETARLGLAAVQRRAASRGATAQFLSRGTAAGGPREHPGDS